MKRISLAGVILAVLLIADGIYMLASNYNDGETQMLGLRDGWIVIISAGIMLLASLLILVFRGQTMKAATPQSVASSEVKSEQA